MFNYTFIRIGLLAGLWLGAGEMAAQLGLHYQTLEGKVADAQSVFRGHITGVKRELLVAKGKALPDGTPYSDGVVVYRFTLEIAETLKGKPAKKISLSRKTSAYNRRIEGWAKARTKFLWFIGPPRKPRTSNPIHAQPPGPSWDFVRLGKEVPAEDGYTKPHALPIFSMDLTVLRTPKAALARARAFAKAHPKGLPTTEFTLPRSLAQHCKPSGDANTISLPITPALEGIARRMITQPHSFAPKNQPPDSLLSWVLRESGVKCLRHFRNEKSIALLRTLLADPLIVGSTASNGTRYHPIRKAAWEQLKAWNVKADKPVITLP